MAKKRVEKRTKDRIKRAKKEARHKHAYEKFQKKDIKREKKAKYIHEKFQRQVLDTYKVLSDGIVSTVNIIGEETGKKYEIKIQEISTPTKALLDTIRQKLVATTEIAFESTGEAIEQAKKKARQKAEILMKEYSLSDENIKLLTAILLHEMFGLGNIEMLISDPQLEEVVINSTENIKVYHKKYGWLTSNLKVENERQIENYSAIIARRVGRQITTLTPMLDAHLMTGDRVNAVLFPISTKGNTITIRKFARDPWTAVDFIANGTCPSEVFALIWTAMQYEMNILFSGGTASGKTSMLNVCMPFIPSNHRIVSIEDTRELQLPEYLYWTPLVTRLPNPEGKGSVTMLDLLINSLRMRPDRIVLGEMRRQEEAEVLFEAMHTGHSVYATVHADTASETISRLVNPPINVPSNLLKTVNICLVMFRDRRKGIRRVYQLSEFVPEESGERESVRANILYRWEPSTDKIVKHLASQRLFEDLSRHTGMSMTDINKDLALKKQILDYLVKNNIRDMKSISEIIQKFYIDPEIVKKIIH